MRINANRPDLIIILPIVCALLLAVNYAGLCRKSGNFKRQADARQKRLNNDFALAANRQAVDSFIKGHAEALMPLAKDVSQEQTAVLKRVETVAKSSNISLSIIKPVARTSDAVMNSYSVEIEFPASVETVTRFAYLIQSGPNYFTVDRMQISAASGLSSPRVTMVVSKDVLHDKIRGRVQ